MDSLQSLASQIDDIKEKLTDKEYKDILETAQKINNEKQRFVKCLVIKHHVITHIKDGEDDDELLTSGGCNGFQFLRDEGQTAAELKIDVDVSTKTEEKIFEVQSSNEDCSCHEIDLDKLTMNTHFYDKFKKRIHRDRHAGLQGAVIVFLKDM